MFAIALLAAALAHSLPLQATAPAPQETARMSSEMTHAHGAFEVKVAPASNAPAEGLTRYTLAKTYTGDLDATGTGEMLAAGDQKAGNAGYVAIERITGKLAGKTGSFALMQQGLLINGSAPQMTVTIVPGSGTGDLSGIFGSMTITFPEGKHAYTLDYAFAAK